MSNDQIPVVLGVSYDKGRLLARMDVLRMTGMEGVPASSKAAAIGAMTQARIDLLVIAADVADADKAEMTAAFRQKQPRGKVLWAGLAPTATDHPPDAMVPPDQPTELARVMMRLIGKKDVPD